MKIKTRWIIRNQWKIFLLKDKKSGFYMLPWWTLENDDVSARACLEREIKEELGIDGIVGKCVLVRELYNTQWILTYDFIFEITNFQDFINIKQELATHWFEYTEFWFYERSDLDCEQLRPKNLFELIEHNMPKIVLLD